MCWDSDLSLRQNTSPKEDDILLEGILTSHLNTIFVPNSHSINQHYSPNNTRQQSTSSNSAQPNTANPNAHLDGINEFLANYSAMRNTLGAPGMGDLGAPVVPVNLDESILSMFMTVRTSEEPLAYEARQAIKAGRISEGQNMLRTRMQETEWHLSPDSSLRILVTQNNIRSRTECEDNGGPQPMVHPEVITTVSEPEPWGIESKYNYFNEDGG